MIKRIRNIYLVFAVVLLSFATEGQVYCNGMGPPAEWYFDGGQAPYDYYLKIDNATFTNNVWQVGKPQKTIIDSAYSFPNCIVTGTSLSYPINNTSVFLFKHLAGTGFVNNGSADISGYYKVDTDTLNDYGKIEISLNQGTTWIDLLTDVTYTSSYTWNTPKPVLSGTSNGWKYFSVFVAPLGSPFNVQGGDTIFYKFSFISDSNFELREGLAFDNFLFCDIIEGIPEYQKNSLITIHPNPATNILNINRPKRVVKESVQILNYYGQLMYKDDEFSDKYIDIGELNLPNGLYFLKYSNTKSCDIKKFVVGH